MITILAEDKMTEYKEPIFLMKLGITQMKNLVENCTKP